MRKLLIILPLIIVLTAACPRTNPGIFKFTNADTTSGNRYTFDGLAPGATAGEGDSGANETPREVVEPDVIRRDGSTLYVLNQFRGLVLVDLETESVLREVPTYGYPRDLYIQDGRAYVLVGYARDYQTDGNTISFSIAARLFVVDISSPSTAHVESSIELTGDFVDSRLVGNILYAVCAEYQWYYATDGGGVTSGGGSTGDSPPIAGGMMAKGVVTKQQTSESWVTSVDVSTLEQVQTLNFPGSANLIQATPEAIFVAAPHWSTDGWSSSTEITVVDISDPAGAMTVKGTVQVEGYVDDRFKMDAYDGVLRVVSQARGWVQSQPMVYITTFSLADLSKVGSTYLQDAIGETVFATRFDGAKAYIVTFLRVDPLFVVDLSDPTSPKVSEGLVVPGWSTYIEPRGDRLIALGVDNSSGAWKVAVSLFDVSNIQSPQLVEQVSFGDNWTWSTAFSDVKALTVLDNVLIIPFSGWNESLGGYDRLQFVSWTPDNLDVRGYVDVNGQVARSFDYSGHYYGVTAEELATIDGSDLDNPTVTNHLTLAEYVADFLELTPSTGVEVITEQDSGKTLVRTVDLTAANMPMLDSVEMDLGMVEDAHVYGSSVVLVGVNWDATTYVSYYMVGIVNCENPAAVEIAKTIRVDVNPYYDWYWWGQYPMDSVRGGVAAGMPVTDIWWVPPNITERTFLLGDTLALRCQANAYDLIFGDQNAVSQGLALIDLKKQEWTSTIGLGYSSIISMNSVGDNVYIGTRETAGYEPVMRPVCAYFLRKLDIAELTAGAAVNVPGAFVQYEPASGVLVLRDDQWDTAGQWGAFTTKLRSVSWDGTGTVTPIDDLALPDGAGLMFARGRKAYFDVYSNAGYQLYSASITANGHLNLGAGLLVTTDWGWLVDAHGNSAYVSVGGGAIARYNFSDGGELAGEPVEVMSAPQSIRFGAETAYVVVGYSGIVFMPL